MADSLCALVAGLLPDAQRGNNGPVPVNIFAHEVIEQTATLTYELQQTLTRTMIVLVRFQVFGQVRDAVRKECDLGFGRTRVFSGFLEALGCKDFLLLFGR